MDDQNRVETDYDHNKNNPGPSKEAVEEKNDKPAGKVLNWVTIIAVVILAIIIFIYYY